MEHTRSEVTEAADAMACVSAQNSEAGKLCGAQLRKKPGVYCRKPVMVGATRCERHGARSKRGPDHPRWKGGAFSKYLPRDLRKRYEAWVRSPELLAARHEVALLKARLQELAGRLGGSGESGEAWRELGEALSELRRAKAAGDEGATTAAVARVGAIIDAANANEVAWAEFTNLAERATLVAQREAKRILEGKMYATAEQVRMIVSSITHAVLANVRDANERRAIAEAVNRLRVIDSIPLDHGQDGDAGEGSNEQCA